MCLSVICKHVKLPIVAMEIQNCTLKVKKIMQENKTVKKGRDDKSPTDTASTSNDQPTTRVNFVCHLLEWHGKPPLGTRWTLLCLRRLFDRTTHKKCHKKCPVGNCGQIKSVHKIYNSGIPAE